MLIQANTITMKTKVKLDLHRSWKGIPMSNYKMMKKIMIYHQVHFLITL